MQKQEKHPFSKQEIITVLGVIAMTGIFAALLFMLEDRPTNITGESVNSEQNKRANVIVGSGNLQVGGNVGTLDQSTNSASSSTGDTLGN